MFKPAEPAERVSGNATMNSIAQESRHDASDWQVPPASAERRVRPNNEHSRRTKHSRAFQEHNTNQN
jgi:hypothetical protein